MQALETARTGVEKRQVLAGLRAVRVLVSGLWDDGDRFAFGGREADLFVRGMLRLGRVSVEEAGGSPCLHVAITTLRVGDLYTVNVAVELLDRVWLVRGTDGEAVEAPVWRRSSSFVSNRHELRENTRRELGETLAGFFDEREAAEAG